MHLWLAALHVTIGAMNKIDVEHLNFFYDGNQALSGVTIGIPDRHITALIGPSGCGKSTFLRCLNRMNDTIPGARAARGGARAPGRRRRAQPEAGRRRPAAARGHGLSETQPIPTVDLRQRMGWVS